MLIPKDMMHNISISWISGAAWRSALFSDPDLAVMFSIKVGLLHFSVLKLSKYPLPDLFVCYQF